ncbi:MAG: hypothetical protein QOF44_5178 [Streptomyces sp.]|jgi:hypothetical protein|nr:hypothetical protein [Streptomyces sp.]
MPVLGQLRVAQQRDLLQSGLGLDAGLFAPPGGQLGLSEGEVVQVEAVGGGVVSGAGGVLPPEAGAVFGVGQLQDAAQDPGTARLGQLLGDEVLQGGGRREGHDGLAERLQVVGRRVAVPVPTERGRLGPVRIPARGW